MAYTGPEHVPDAAVFAGIAEAASSMLSRFDLLDTWDACAAPAGTQTAQLPRCSDAHWWQEAEMLRACAGVPGSFAGAQCQSAQHPACPAAAAAAGAEATAAATTQLTPPPAQTLQLLPGAATRLEGEAEVNDAEVEAHAEALADAEPWARDCVTLTCLVHPYIASDGYTYSLQSLLFAARADPLHRSPITGEVLRDVAFPNLLVDGLLPWKSASVASLCLPPSAPSVCLYDRAAPAEGADATSTVTVQAPLRMSVPASMQRLRWQLPEQFSVTYQVLGDRLVHPPAFLNAAEDIVQLARALNIHRAVSNPECLTWARLSTGVTVEEQWCRVIGCSGQ